MQKRSDELLINAWALVARMEVKLPEGDDAAPRAGQGKIDTNGPPKNFKDAMLRTDRQEWAEAYDKEYQGFKEHGTLKDVHPVPGVKILGTTVPPPAQSTRW